MSAAQEFSEIDRAHMRAAIALAREPVFAPHPNPRVGCVIANGERIIATGFHERAGAPHAEIEALNSLSSDLARAVMYVTLEPCVTHGRTPPCVDAVIDSGIRSVMAAAVDPNPATCGTGVRRLRDAGIDVRVGLEESAARELNKGYFARHEKSVPWVTVKSGASLDGRTAASSGESAWITSEEARQDVQSLRAECAAVLTGSKTVLNDDPRLNCRIDGGDGAALRVVMDSRLSIPADARMFDVPGKVIIASLEGCDADRERRLRRRADVLKFSDNGAGRVGCADLLRSLAQKYEVNSVLVEAGPTLTGALIEEGLVDEVVVYLAPSMLGAKAFGIAALPGVETLAQRVELEFTDVRGIGPDIRITAKVVRAER